MVRSCFIVRSGALTLRLRHALRSNRTFDTSLRKLASSAKHNASVFPVAGEEKLARDGFLKIPGMFSQNNASDTLSTWVEEIEAMPTAASNFRSLNQVWHHFEGVGTPETPSLTRTENFALLHKGFKSYLTGESSPVVAATSAALGEPSVLYKEKINYKYPGGGGYAAHQDAPAYRELANHVTCLIAVDAMDENNGCLEFAAGRHNEGLIALTEHGTIDPKVSSTMDYVAVPLKPGDALLFSSYVPHRSMPNNSDRPRRALYLTYNALSEGDLRSAYYSNKADSMDHDSLSLIKHFDGNLLSGEHALVAELKLLYETKGLTQYDPSVTQLEHALQTAALAQADHPDDHELIAAALLHDVGHLLLDEHSKAEEGFLTEDLQHECAGFAFLENSFSPRIAGICKHHVDAKRYLCGKDAVYWAGLSDASKRSLELQGGPFTPDECAAFERQPHAMDAVQIRRYDDKGKMANLETPPLDAFLGYVEKAVRL